MHDWNAHRLLSRKEAADFLGVKEITLAIWQSTKRYKIPVVKVGRLVRYLLKARLHNDNLIKSRFSIRFNF